MIVTVTLNPAMDQTLVLPKFVAGDTLRVKSSRIDPGGKGINVSRVIRELGGESIAMGFAPGALGRFLLQTLEAQGIICDFIRTTGEMRTNITLLDESRHLNTILSEPGPATNIEAVSDLKARLGRILREGDWLVIAGSIPPPLDASVYADLIRDASEVGVHTLLDADGEALAQGASAQPEILKGNRRELERLIGSRLGDEKSTLAAARKVQAWGIPLVLVTRGRQGAVAVGERVLRGIAPRVRAISAVGSGDAFLAGMVLTLSRGGSLEEAMELGIASGTAAVLTPGTELCHRREVDILRSRVRVEPIESLVGSNG
ncbi:MAG: 1-phosphofructokinase family hexose kinase [Chloroflexi bacterium]|nr:1-phosphofructokinase family hexose kinase [Chloroflexota bacterium]